MSQRYEAAAVKRQVPIVWERAEGVMVEDVDGNRFLDFTSSVLVANIGHSHPRHVEAIRDQASKNLHSYNFLNPWRVRLAQKLVEITAENLDKVFLGTTGAEMVDIAVTIAKSYTGRQEILSFYGGYHGKTWATLSLGGKASSRKGLGPKMPGVLHAPYPYCYRCDFDKTFPACELHCLKYLDRVMETESSDDLAAVLVEPCQGNSGQIIPPVEWMKGLERWCHDRGALLILDEVQASFGRTGKLFAYEHFEVKPDLLIVGKGISSGIPLTALIGEGRILDAARSGSLSSTHGGNPLACRAACVSIEILESEGMVESSARVGRYLLERCKALSEEIGILGDTRGLGLMIGLEIVEDKGSKRPAPELARRIVQGCYQQGLLLIGPIGFYSNVIRIAPPLVIQQEEAAAGMDILEGVMREIW